MNSGWPFIPLQALPQARASFVVWPQPALGVAVLGFEYGCAHAPGTLPQQFGDSANAGQVVIDQLMPPRARSGGSCRRWCWPLPHAQEARTGLPERTSGALPAAGG